MILVGTSPEINSIDSFPLPSFAPVFSIFLSSNTTVDPSAATPVSLNVAPGSSSSPLTDFLLMSTSVVHKASNTLTIAGLSSSAGITEFSEPVTTPSFIVNVTAEAISYPSGAAVSVRV